MIAYYCKKCKCQGESAQCPRCGKSLTAAARRIVWRYTRVPVLDGIAWGGVVRVSLAAAALAALLLFGAEFAMRGLQGMQQLWLSGLPAALAAVPAAACALALLVFLLQGREEQRYVLDNQGAHVQVWLLRPRPVRCWARLMSAQGLEPDEETGEEPEGLLVCERHLPWQDVRGVRVQKHLNRILLYRPRRFLSLALYVDAADFDEAAELTRKCVKRLAKIDVPA